MPSKKKKKKKIIKNIPRGKVYIKSTYNNTIVTITDLQGNVFASASGGMVGFHGPKKATPYAAGVIAKHAAEKASKFGLKDIHVYVKGVGAGREAAIRALANCGLNILSIKDITPVPHNGCRPPKVRRV